jgi:hypothetical protein
MIFILGIALAFFRFKQIIARHQLENGAGQAPHVSGLVVLASEAYLWGAVLPRLNDVRELIINIAGVSHVDQLHTELQGYNTLQVVLI